VAAPVQRGYTVQQAIREQAAPEGLVQGHYRVRQLIRERAAAAGPGASGDSWSGSERRRSRSEQLQGGPGAGRSGEYGAVRAAAAIREP
jgi:hypothetical protein